MTASFRMIRFVFQQPPLGRVGGYFFCIAKIYPVATINKRITPISDISPGCTGEEKPPEFVQIFRPVKETNRTQSGTLWRIC